FLAWQADIVREYAREDQFITHNFDYEWRGYSFGVQPAVNHFEAGRALDISGVDIYHPTEERLTGKEIAFGGDTARSVKDGKNFIVLETEAQGQHGWLPYPGQLRLQAYSHVANGADGVMYWHWHSIHNSFETYWKGVLSHDFAKNPTYEEAGVFGREMANPARGGRLVHAHKNNRVAMMVSNEALSALNWFQLETGFPWGGTVMYNDVVRRFYDALFELNVEVDIIPVNAEVERINRYDMVLTPALYVAPQSTIDNLRAYVEQGGHLVSTLRSFVCDENTTVWQDAAPHGLTDVFGVSYNQFTRPDGAVTVSGSAAETFGAEALIELLNVDGGSSAGGVEVLGSYDHYA
nr:beta-galactosidase trimerization domain-containing protein [Alloscardovia omnicolens]